MRRVAIYLRPGDSLADQYLVSLLCSRWRDAGLEPVFLHDPEDRVEADAAIVHVDLTRRPAAYDRVLERYPLVINGAVRDISKRRVSAQLVTRASGYSGPVIVKTDDNCFGAPDWRGPAWSRGLAGLASRWAERVLPLRRTIRERRTYPIYPSADRVPRAVWWDPRLVVERFLPERRGWGSTTASSTS